VNVKSTILKDILREILKRVTCVNLRKNKPSIKTFLKTVNVNEPFIFTQINLNILFTYLPQLKTYRETNTKTNFTKKLHLNKLTKFLIKHYASINERLTALVKYKKITFELLPIFFRPNEIIYIIIANSEKSKYFILNFK
jgi:hypothetical protein